MSDRHKHLRTVEGGQSDGPNRHGPVPRAAFLAEQHGRRAAVRKARAAETRADRLGEIVAVFLGAQPLATKERIIGAGYARLVEMTDAEFGAYRARVQIALGSDDE